MYLKLEWASEKNCLAIVELEISKFESAVLHNMIEDVYFDEDHMVCWGV